MNTGYRHHQHYAVSDTGKLVHIEHLDENENYYCVNCNCHMLPKRGKKNEWHFAHDYMDERNTTCSYESYLHKLAKFKIQEWFEKDTPIHIEYPIISECNLANDCKWKESEDNNCSETKYEKYNLKNVLNKSEIEKRIKANDTVLTADLLWYNERNPQTRILIEVKVTHGCSEEKINSGEKIIEFTIQSEDDIDKVIGNVIRQNEYTTFYSIHKKKTCNPKYNLKKFIFFETQKIYPFRSCTCQDYAKRQNKSLFELTLKETVPNTILIQAGLAALLKNKIDYRNCLICENHNDNGDFKCGSCAINKYKIENVTKANSCINYRLSINKYQKYNKRLFDLECFKHDMWWKNSQGF
ncbi:MAG: hypothetical protein HDT01_04835 [Bacteroidales bacterium]|nr:hypothetical protein [Bacteroidales bacterium]